MGRKFWKDIYKELGVLGLDYGPHFQRLKRIQTNDFRDIYGINEWDGNFVTYLDAMLQSMVFSAPFRKLMVPVMIRTIRVDPRVFFENVNRNRNVEQTATDIEQSAVADVGLVVAVGGDTQCCSQWTIRVDPRVFFENVNRNRNVEQKPMETMDSENSIVAEVGKAIAVGGEMAHVSNHVDEETLTEAKILFDKEIARKKERFSVFSADMPFHFNVKSKRLVAHGIEVEDLMAFPIPRRSDGTDLVLDTYQFFPNEDVEAIDTNDKRVVTEYIEVCKAMAAKIKLIGCKDITCDFNYQNISDDVIQEYRTTNNENHVMFRIFDKILTEVVDENKNMKNSKEVMKVLKDIESGAEYDLKKDLINQIQKNEHMIRTLVDIVCENFVTIKEIKVTEINLSTGILAKEVDQIMSLFRIMPYDVDYKLQKLITAKEADNQTDNVWLMANDLGINGIVGLVNSMRLEPGGENFRYIFNMDSNSETNIDFTTKPYSDILANDLVANVIKGGKLGSYRHIKLPKDSDKVLSNEYFLNLGQTRDLAGLQWYDLRSLSPKRKTYDFNGQKVTKNKINIYSTGLSFHDVMLATGRIPSGPEVVFMDCTIGGEFAGRLVETGERVMGMESGRCFATSVYAATHTYAKIPDHWSMNDAERFFCSTTAIEIALFEVMKALDITPDGIIGHSFGEIACAYADGCLSTRDAMVVTYFRGAVTESDHKIPKGLMAVVGLSRNEAIKLCPNGVYVVCNNAKDTVVVSGPIKEMKELIKTLEEKTVFVRQLESSEIPYHSQYLITSAKPMTEAIKKYIPNPRLRSRKWVSTSLMTTDPDDQALKYASAEYFVYNLLNPVQFYDKFKSLPLDAIVLELSPHSVFSKIVTETLENSTHISLIKKYSNDTNLDMFLSALAIIYELDEFCVLENDNVCVVGKVRTPDDEVLLTPNAILERQKLMASTQYSLDRKDIYKELGILGLDYGPHFQRLKRIQTNDFRDIYGINEWDGNFVTYLDAMLQSMAFTVPFRKLMVPVMIRTVRVDPRVLFHALRLNRNLLLKCPNDKIKVSNDLIQESPFLSTAKSRSILDSHNRKFIERYAKYSAEMPFYFDAKCRRLVAHGLEVEGVILLPIPRHPPVADLVLDSYQFLANEDHDAITLVDTQMVNQYLEVGTL
ncbi:unnamed protein product [Medioppia subpectinata]|uniref:Malonyl-CoA:ACP transacylase (MAT) domain-containing protein n=1 Tax=Medioppia subpectinata TaxID=1979941 RepID=A0A7R9PVY2_9ACAR|nr:unnamed protein product [Medioppia subpectinata]CAG2102295.1 unnamed protein product [Medioppia subpectinata]